MISGSLSGSNIKLKISNIEIGRVWKTKFLGVVIDYKLNWKKNHAEYVKGKISKSIAIIAAAQQWSGPGNFRQGITGKC